MSDVVVVVAEIIVGLALLTVVGAAVGVVVNRLTAKKSPTEMLQERYIHGELTHEQYEQMRRDLTGTSAFVESVQATRSNGHEAEVVPGIGKTK